MSEDSERIRESVHIFINQGIQLIKKDRYIEAIEFLSKAQSIANKCSFKDEELQSLISLSACALSVGDRLKAVSYARRALKVSRDLNDKMAQGKCLLNIGVIYIETDPEKALSHFNEALAVFEEKEYLLGIAQCLDNIGALHQTLGCLRAAANYIDKANLIFKQAGEPIELAKSYMLIGNLMTDMAREGLEEPKTIRPIARDNYEKALHIFEQVKAPVNAASCLDMLGLLCRDEEKFDEAIILHQKASEIYQKYGVKGRLSSALLHLGSTHIKRKDYDAALDAYSKARQLKEELQDTLGYARVCHNEAVAMNECGLHEDATCLLKESLKIREEILERITDEEHRSNYVAQYYSSWSEYLYSLSKVIDSIEQEDKIIFLLSELEKSKARMLRLHLTDISHHNWRENSKFIRLLHEEIKLLNIISSAGDERVSLRERLKTGLLSQEIFDESMKSLISKAQRAFFSLEKIRNRVSNLSDEKSLVVRKSEIIPDSDEVLRSSIEPIVVHMLDFHQRKALCFIVMHHGHVVSYRIVEMDSEDQEYFLGWLEKLYSGRYIYDLDSWEDYLSRISDYLGELLNRGGVLNNLKEENRRIFFIPQGKWHLFPWEIAACPGGYLGTKYALARNYSATLLSMIKQNIISKKGIEKQHMALVFCPEAEDLEWTKIEAKQVSEILQINGIETFEVDKENATREKFIQMIRDRNFSILHFAGHSAFNNKNPLLSALALNPEKNLMEDDGRTTALEIERRVRFKCAPLIYLNSCESAIAEVKEGDEAFGLVRAFLLSGASSLVLASWSVVDESAIDLAKAFYREFSKGRNPAEALRIARCEVSLNARSGKYQLSGQFVHWGPFLIYGEPFVSMFDSNS